MTNCKIKKCREFKRWIGKDWDYSFLLKMEQYKFRRMAKYFNKSRLVEGWEKQVSVCKLCDKLISIILEEDPYYNSWLNSSYGTTPHKHIPFPAYVNTRNYKRFNPLIDNLHEDNEVLHTGILIGIREVKAMSLYNKVRTLYLCKLWD